MLVVLNINTLTKQRPSEHFVNSKQARLEDSTQRKIDELDRESDQIIAHSALTRQHKQSLQYTVVSVPLV